MTDSTCTTFLKWALPRMGLRWPGFHRVRRQVCKRLDRRVRALGLGDLAAYRAYLESHPDEWRLLDGLCRIPISRFFRDPDVFGRLGRAVMPELARAASVRGETRLRCWSAGCASGEEPYGVALLWAFEAAARSPPLDLDVVATDTEPHLLERARAAQYPASSLKDLPPGWRQQAFTPSEGQFKLRSEYRRCVSLLRQDVREEAPQGPFDLVLCRNLAFTYFAEPVQRRVLEAIMGALVPGGALVIGANERLPDGDPEFSDREAKLGLFRRLART